MPFLGCWGEATNGNETNGSARAIFYLILFMSRVSNGIQFYPEKSVKRYFRKMRATDTSSPIINSAIFPIFGMYIRKFAPTT